MTQLAGNPRDVKSLLFSRNAQRFKRRDIVAWCAPGGPSAYSSMGAFDVVLR